MNKKILMSAAVLAIIAIVFGAFGAHKLKELLTVQQLTSFETGVRYQMYHVFLLLFLGMFNGISKKNKQTIFYVILAGILCFSGSIYVLSTQSITGLKMSFIGVVTPLGGLLLIVGWCLLLRNFVNIKSS